MLARLLIFFCRMLEIPLFLHHNSNCLFFCVRTAVFGEGRGFWRFGKGIDFDGNSFVDGLVVLGDDWIGGGKHVIKGKRVAGVVFAF